MVQCADDSEGDKKEEHEAQHLEVRGGSGRARERVVLEGERRVQLRVVLRKGEG